MPEQDPQPSRGNLPKHVFTPTAEEIFLSAMDIIEASERTTFLGHACAQDPELYAAVQTMLDAQSKVDDFFGDVRQAMSDPRDNGHSNGKSILNGKGPKFSDENIGSCIGPYKLLQVIGEGGCGVVYLAEQEKPVRRSIALKIIKLGMDTKSVIARFDAERQTLALMDHPNIARVLDAGATETGRPYFVMELVRGVKLTTYCDQNQLNIHRRLDLFTEVCHAIQHAHQKGIIHRDIKPSNVLVTTHDDMPMPMVIDFGIAKAVEGRFPGHTAFTPNEQFIGTPAYMSPEQSETNRLDVDTRSDIYSLGVLLYELLTGKTPFDGNKLAQLSIDEMRRTLREQEPLRPSAILSTFPKEELAQLARSRQAEPGRLISSLKGDLDWIVIKALEKDRNRRYQTANGIAMDVQRYLDHEPIVARPPSRMYRLRKTIRRNKAVFASGAAVTLALAVGMGISICLLIRARAAEREEARLRNIAERGMQMEAELRHQAEGRQKLAQAVMLLNAKDYSAADDIAAQLTLEQATIEGAELFRTLGEWNAIQQQWTEAQRCFEQLQQATRLERQTMVSLDATRLAVSVFQRNNRSEYEKFCQRLVQTFAGTQDPVVAERTVKNCLLMAPSPRIMESLKPFVACAKKSLEGVDFTSRNLGWQVPWRCLTLALWEYRSGNLQDAAVWSRRCINTGTYPPPRCLTAEVILAMTEYRLGQKDIACAEFDEAGNAVLGKEVDSPGNSDEGFWFDWIIGRILLREASAMTDKISTVPPPSAAEPGASPLLSDALIQK